MTGHSKVFDLELPVVNEAGSNLFQNSISLLDLHMIINIMT